MSFNNYFLLEIILISLFFASCQDRQKDSDVKVEITKEVSGDTLLFEKVSEKTDESKNINPSKITNENVVEFLTLYGKINQETKLQITTKYGNIDIELYNDAPLHRANFIYLIKQQYFTDTFFHRVVPNFIIQGGNSDLRSTPKKRAAIGNYLLPAEVSNGRNHEYGTLSGAKEYRENPDKKSAPFEFFIFLGPQTSTSHLNGNYTVFGRVTKGMDIVDKIANVKTDEGDWPLQNIYIDLEIRL